MDFFWKILIAGFCESWKFGQGMGSPPPTRIGVSDNLQQLLELKLGLDLRNTISIFATKVEENPTQTNIHRTILYLYCHGQPFQCFRIPFLRKKIN